MPSHGLRVGAVAAFVVLAAFGPGPRAAADVAPAKAGDTVRPQALMAHMRFLADDRLEGRDTGTRGYDLAALYVAARFEALGLEPAGDAGSYYQRVPLRSAQVDPSRSRLSWSGGKRGETLAVGVDFIAAPNFHRDRSEVEAPVVFVGYGVRAPELDHDDYAGIDVKGRIVAFLLGAPPGFPNDQRAHYGQPLIKALTAVEQGAVGALLLHSQAAERILPWRRMVAQARPPAMRWLDGDGRPADAPEGLRAGAVLGAAASERLFAAGGRSLDEAVARARAGARGGFALGVTARLRIETRHADIDSPNVAGRLRGADPRLAPQTIVISAHLDHLGVGEARDGDAIYNGAYDNASGVAGLLELARLFAGAPAPRRSVLFLAVTAEERGLLGSDYFARHAAPAELVANVNLDMIAMLAPFRDVIAFGAEHSSLGDDMARAAQAVGLELSPDPWPEQSLFVRSDHYSFVRQGVPAIYPVPGLESADAGRDLGQELRAWIGRVYHTPQDDLSQRFVVDGGARLVQAAYLAARAVAQADGVPRWRAGDFFGETFGRRSAPAPADTR